MRFPCLLMSLSILTACGAEADARLGELEDSLAWQDQAIGTLSNENQTLLTELETLRARVDTLSTTEAQTVALELQEHQDLLDVQAGRLLALESSMVGLDAELGTLNGTVLEQGMSLSGLSAAQLTHETAITDNAAAIAADLVATADNTTLSVANQDDVASLYTQLSTAQGEIADLESRADSLELVSADAEDLLVYLSADTSTDQVLFSGANVYIQSGSGASADTTTGLGNLVIGYDESDTDSDKSGAHNLIVGPYHSYSSFGGLVTGYNNQITGDYAVALGTNNVASGDNSVVSGGYDNEARGLYTSVTGGLFNDARGAYSSVGGGIYNQSTGAYSAIVGGHSNETSGIYAAILGGYDNAASGDYSTVYGSTLQSATGDNDYAP